MAICVQHVYGNIVLIPILKVYTLYKVEQLVIIRWLI